MCSSDVTTLWFHNMANFKAALCISFAKMVLIFKCNPVLYTVTENEHHGVSFFNWTVQGPGETCRGGTASFVR